MSRNRLSTDIGPFGIMPLWLLKRLRDEPRAVQLFAWINARYADREGRAFPKRELLAADLGCSVKSIERAIEVLREAGGLLTERKHHPSTGYITGLDFQLVHIAPDDGFLPLADPLIGGQSDTSDAQAGVRSQSDTGVVQAKRQSDTGVRAKATPVSQQVLPRSNEPDPEERTRGALALTAPSDDEMRRWPVDKILTPAEVDAYDAMLARDAADGFALIAPPVEKPLGVGDVIAAYRTEWSAAHAGVTADFGKAEAGMAKALCAKHDPAALVEAVRRYVISPNPFYATAVHPFRLFARDAGALIAAIVSPVSRSPRRPDGYVDDKLALAREREALDRRLRLDAVAAINAMSADALAALRSVAESHVRESFADYPDYRPTAEELARRVADAMVGRLIDHGRGRSMAETAHDFEPRADAQGVA